MQKNNVTLINKQCNHKYQTLPELCNPTTPFVATKPHCLHPKIFRLSGIPNDPVCCMALLAIE